VNLWFGDSWSGSKEGGSLTFGEFMEFWSFIVSSWRDARALGVGTPIALLEDVEEMMGNL